MKTSMTIEKWAETPDINKYNGYSPGGAAAELKISRQMIYRLIRQDKLDTLVLLDLNGEETGFLVTLESIERYKALRHEYGQRIKNEKENKKKQMGIDYE